MKNGDNPKGSSETPSTVERHTTPDGRVVNDVLSLIRSPEAKRHFEQMDRLAEMGLVPKPATKPS